jgi:hypothetical protein
MEYDWEHRVNTTSGTVEWRERLLGMFHSPYQPTEPGLFFEMMGSLPVEPRGFTFIDLGSGKGRTLLMAANYPFRRIVGVELLAGLHRVAEENLARYRNPAQKCFALEAVWGDAADFVFPVEPTLLYLFNPLPEAALRRVFSNLSESLRTHPRPLYVVYHNPTLDRLLDASEVVSKLAGTLQYSVYASRSALP